MLTGAQLDAIIIGAGTINLGDGHDTIYLTSTSDDLNALGEQEFVGPNSIANERIQGVEEILARATAGVKIILGGQHAAFEITGSQFDDTITGGFGADTIDGGAGVDVLSGGGGDDLIVLATSDFAPGESDSRRQRHARPDHTHGWDYSRLHHRHGLRHREAHRQHWRRQRDDERDAMCGVRHDRSRRRHGRAQRQGRRDRGHFRARRSVVGL